MTTVQVPTDIEGLGEFRRSEARLGRERARALTLRLWIELGLSARSHERPGFMPEADARAMLGAELAECEADGWLAPADGGWTCHHFARVNGRGGPESRETVGARMSRVGPMMRRLARDNAQLGLMLDEEACRDAAGSGLSPEEISRCTLLIRTLDCMFDQPPRKYQKEFTPGLMAAAAEVVRLLDPPALEATLRRITRHQTGPVLAGVKPERLLTQWREILGKLPL